MDGWTHTHTLKLILWAKLDLNHNNYIGISLFGNVYSDYCDILKYIQYFGWALFKMYTH